MQSAKQGHVDVYNSTLQQTAYYTHVSLNFDIAIVYLCIYAFTSMC